MFYIFNKLFIYVVNCLFIKNYVIDVRFFFIKYVHFDDIKEYYINLIRKIIPYNKMLKRFNW